ncbi:hypothetical protein NMY22_g9841 [Coprinellus aureogranulatus]|nr:hypothetical protein NMY22_g9841 [Coprinellus aureogranulatus]
MLALGEGDLGTNFQHYAATYAKRLQYSSPLFPIGHHLPPAVVPHRHELNADAHGLSLNPNALLDAVASTLSLAARAHASTRHSARPFVISLSNHSPYRYSRASAKEVRFFPPPRARQDGWMADWLASSAATSMASRSRPGSWPSQALQHDDSLMDTLNLNSLLLLSKKDTVQVRIKQEPDLEQLAGRFTTILDQKLQEHSNKMQSLLDDVKSTKEKFEILLRQPHNFAVATQARQPRPPPFGNNNNCFYCGETGHYMSACTDRQKHIQEGRIRNDPLGTFSSRDGRRVIARPGELLKDVVERTCPMGTSQNFQGYGDWEQHSQYHVGTAPESEWATRDDIRHLTDAIAQMSASKSVPVTCQQPTTQPVQRDPWENMDRLHKEQSKTNQLMEQFLSAMTRTQFVATRANPQHAEENAEDFHFSI